MRPLHNINPEPFTFKVSQRLRVITWRIGNRIGRTPIRNTKPSAISAQIQSIATRFNTQEIYHV